MSSFKLGDRTIGASEATYFIADLAANHDGSLERAKHLIDLVARAGASAVKFQHFRAKFIVSDRGFRELKGKLSHQRGWGKSVFETYDDASLPWDWTKQLAQVAKDCGVDFFTAPYDLEAIDFVNEFIAAFKVGSGDITWIESIDAMASKGKPIFIATGASNLEDVNRAVETIRSRKVDFCLMQCNTNYTGEANNRNYANVNVLKTFAKEFPDAVLGLSDHTVDNYTVLAATALGACVIEKHFTDDRGRTGPDHAFSLDFKAWQNMVVETEILRNTLGDGTKKIELNELETAIIQRRALRYQTNLPLGHVLRLRDLIALRPCPSTGVAPFQINEIVGKTLKESVLEDQLLELKHIEH